MDFGGMLDVLVVVALLCSYTSGSNNGPVDIPFPEGRIDTPSVFRDQNDQSAASVGSPIPWVRPLSDGLGDGAPFDPRAASVGGLVSGVGGRPSLTSEPRVTGGYRSGAGRIWCTCRRRCRFREWTAKTRCSLPGYPWYFRTCCRSFPWWPTRSVGGYGGYGTSGGYGGSGPYTAYGGSGPYTGYGGSGPYTAYGGSGPYTGYGGSGPYTRYGGSSPYNRYGGISPYSGNWGSNPYSGYGVSGPFSRVGGRSLFNGYRESSPYSGYGGSSPYGVYGGRGAYGRYGGFSSRRRTPYTSITGSGGIGISKKG